MIFIIFFFIAFLLVLILLCMYFPMQCYHNLDMEGSMCNINLAWQYEVDNVLLDEVYLCKRLSYMNETHADYKGNNTNCRRNKRK